MTRFIAVMLLLLVRVVNCMVGTRLDSGWPDLLLLCCCHHTADADWNREVLQWATEHLPAHAKGQITASRYSSSGGVQPSSALACKQLLGQGGGADRPTMHLQLPECHPKQQYSHDLPASLQPMQQLFCGLRVRMAVASGIADGVKLHRVTRRVEYNGTTMRRVQALADAPDGGQVGNQLIDMLFAHGSSLAAQNHAWPLLR